MYGNGRWTYGFFGLSGFEDFADLARFSKPNPDEALPLIDEKEAIRIALHFVAEQFKDASIADTRKIRFSRVWDEAQSTPDEGERIIQKTSNESIVKIFRSINGLPVFGCGYYRIHLGNDGVVVGAFSQVHKIVEAPIESISLLSKEDIDAIVKEKTEYYCKNAENCFMKVDVGYYEADHQTRQTVLEPFLVFRISVKTKSGESIARHFTIPMRDPNIAENPSPEG